MKRMKTTILEKKVMMQCLRSDVESGDDVATEVSNGESEKEGRIFLTLGA